MADISRVNRNDMAFGTETCVKPELEDPTVGALYAAHYAEVLAYCARRVGRDGADDAASEVFMIAWRRRDEIDWTAARPWLFGIARGVIANGWRSQRRRLRLVGRIGGLAPDSPPAPDVVVVRREEDREVLEALAELGDVDREVLTLSAWEGMSAPEIAAAIGISPSAAEQRLHRAKRRLAKVLGASREVGV